LLKIKWKWDWKNIDKVSTLLSAKVKARFQMDDTTQRQRMTVADFFEALASDEDFISPPEIASNGRLAAMRGRQCN